MSQIRLDESQEHEANQLGDRLQHELEILTAYQSKSRMAADSQRGRERRELEERVGDLINKKDDVENVTDLGECKESTSGTEDGGGE